MRADEVLTERQKSALIDIYAACRKEAENAAALAASTTDADQPVAIHQATRTTSPTEFTQASTY